MTTPADVQTALAAALAANYKLSMADDAFGDALLGTSATDTAAYALLREYATLLAAPAVVPPVVPIGPTPLWVKPTHANTGFGQTVLKPVGGLSTTAAGQIITSLDVKGGITINHPNCWIHHARFDTLVNTANLPVLLEDFEAFGSGDQGVGFANYTARRGYLHGTGDGFKGFGNCVIESCLVDNLRNAAGDHGDPFQSGGNSHMRLSGNNFGYDDRRTPAATFSDAAIMVKAEAGTTIDDVLIEYNWLNGGGYTLRLENFGKGLTNVRVVGNKFGPDFLFGPLEIQAGPGCTRPVATFSGNVGANGNEVKG